MSNLIKLNNVEELIKKAEEYSWTSKVIDVSSIVSEFQKAIIKLEDFPICEIFGYQIASALEIRVPKMQGFGVQDKTNSEEFGKVGILIEYYDDWKCLSREEALKVDLSMTARAMALCAFDRHEWGEFGLSNNKLYFVDLERLLAPVYPHLLLSKEVRIEWLADQAEGYERMSRSMIEEVLREADDLGILKQVEDILRNICALRPNTYESFLKITGHPLDSMLSKYAAHNFGNRMNSIAELYGLPTHTVTALPNKILH